MPLLFSWAVNPRSVRARTVVLWDLALFWDDTDLSPNLTSSKKWDSRFPLWAANQIAEKVRSQAEQSRSSHDYKKRLNKFLRRDLSSFFNRHNTILPSAHISIATTTIIMGSSNGNRDRQVMSAYDGTTIGRWRRVAAMLSLLICALVMMWRLTATTTFFFHRRHPGNHDGPQQISHSNLLQRFYREREKVTSVREIMMVRRLRAVSSVPEEQNSG